MKCEMKDDAHFEKARIRRRHRLFIRISQERHEICFRTNPAPGGDIQPHLDALTPSMLADLTGLIHLFEADVLGVLMEALTAHVQAVFTDQTMTVAVEEKVGNEET